MFNLSILNTHKQLETWRRQHQCHINFVPTMGSLHEGHQKLIQTAQKISNKEKSVVLVSVFVNPLQFGPSEDFERYPRDLEKDCELALEAGANAIWAPSLEQVLPGGIESHFKLEAPKKLTSNLCGAHRKNHFDGVSTIIVRLLNLVKPNHLILGEKDWQQLIIIRKLIKDLNLNIKVINVPTFRDVDGLALSTRNKYLTRLEREKALLLPKKLESVANGFNSGENIDTQTIKTSLEDNDIKVEYVELVDPESLQIREDTSKSSLLAAAIQIGKTRLIDHKFLMNRSPIVAIDGPAGAGKSTITKIFARKMGLLYLDTGAMYRAVTWLIQEQQIDPKDKINLEKLLKNINLKLKITRSGDQKVFINENEITNAIRSPEVTSKVSSIAAQSYVREVMTAQQKQIGLKGGIVAEGRDIGTSVFPDADLKIFLTASPKERAKRRSLDLKEQGFPIPDLIELENQIKERDQLDSNREISPLMKADDAKELITDGMSIEEVTEYIIEMFRLKVPEEIWSTPLD